MRAKQSSTATGNYSCFGSFTSHSIVDAADPGPRIEGFADQVGCELQACPAAAQGEGLLHDARNLVGAIGLYCDLLSMPGVLKPEHRQYPEELRLLGARSRSLIDTLMRSLPSPVLTNGVCPGAVAKQAVRLLPGTAREMVQHKSAGASAVSLRPVVERCSGLLSRVANGRAIEIDYGPAAAAPVRIAEEAVERILVNLVRNAAAALGEGARASGPAGAGERPSGSIRITVGLLVNRVGEAKPWPFQRVRISVEDCGSGMSPEQRECLLHGRGPSDKSHGIGFRVVRELVAASEGDLQVMSSLATGTRVQIEWPVAAASVSDAAMWETEQRLAQTPSAKVPAVECRLRRAGDTRTAAEMEGAC